MRVYFSQIYVEVGVTFPFSIRLQQRLSEEINPLIECSKVFAEKYGADWNLIFRISARRALSSAEIRGPSVFRKDRSVEFSIFLPFENLKDNYQAALNAIIDAACEVLSKLGFELAKVKSIQTSLVQELCADPATFKEWSR